MHSRYLRYVTYSRYQENDPTALCVAQWVLHSNATAIGRIAVIALLSSVRIFFAPSCNAIRLPCVCWGGLIFEVVCIQFLHRERGFDFAADEVFHHELGEFFAVDEDDFFVGLLSVSACLCGKVAGGDEDAFVGALVNFRNYC